MITFDHHEEIVTYVAEQVTSAFDDDMCEMRERLAVLEKIVSDIDFFKADRHHVHN